MFPDNTEKMVEGPNIEPVHLSELVRSLATDVSLPVLSLRFRLRVSYAGCRYRRNSGKKLSKCDNSKQRRVHDRFSDSSRAE